MFTVTSKEGNFYSLPVDQGKEECIGVSLEGGHVFLGMESTVIELNLAEIESLISVLEHVRDLIK